MNPKIALFLSASLTAFVLATLAGVAGKVASAPAAVSSASGQAAVVQQPTVAPTQEPLPQPTDLPAPTAQLPLGPEEAANLAAQAINRQDVYSVESSTYQGTEAYKVVFSSGDVVYIGLDRTVLTTTKLQPVVVNVAPTQAPKKHRNENNNSGSSAQASASTSDGGGEHEGGDD
jgi:hypothetical protein